MLRAKIKNKKKARRSRVKRGIRKKIFGTSSRPRLTVFRSNKHTYAQLIDDIRGHTVAAASTLDEDVEGEEPLAASRAVGEELARRAKEAGIDNAVFDRNGYRYHGRVKAVAEGARSEGLQL